MKYSISAVTDIGECRSENEDLFLISGNEEVTGSGRIFEASADGEGNCLALVADGMGGGGAGAWAAECAAKTIRSVVLNRHEGGPLHEIVQLALENANSVVFNQGQNDPAVTGCATAIAFLVQRKGDVCLARVGSVGLFIVRGKQVSKVLRECNFMGLGWCGGPPEGWPTEPENGLLRLFNCLGGHAFFDSSIASFKVRPGDSILLLSDGITEKVTEGEIQKLVSELKNEVVVRELVRLGKERGGEDNLTAVSCRFGDPEKSDSGEPVSRDLTVVRVQFTQESDLGRYVTDAVKCCIRHGYFKMARRIVDTVPEDGHRDDLLGLLEEECIL